MKAAGQTVGKAGAFWRVETSVEPETAEKKGGVLETGVLAARRVDSLPIGTAFCRAGPLGVLIVWLYENCLTGSGDKGFLRMGQRAVQQLETVGCLVNDAALACSVAVFPAQYGKRSLDTVARYVTAEDTGFSGERNDEAGGRPFCPARTPCPGRVPERVGFGYGT